jgi:hypothetical protein
MSRRRALWFSGIASILLLAVLAGLDQRLQDTGGPGMIPFEVAGSEQRASEIVSEWGTGGRDDARLSLWLDYAFLVAYAAFLALAVAATRDLARARGWVTMHRVGRFLIWFPIAGAVFDALENTGLLVTLGGDGGAFAPRFAMVCACAKFALETTTIIYLLIGLARRAVEGRRSGPADDRSVTSPPSSGNN